MDGRTYAAMAEAVSRMNWLIGYAGGLGGNVPPEVEEAVRQLMEIVYGTDRADPA